jgi:PhzF family phenazine biosynthesis protein
LGNPAAVVFRADSLETTEMQIIARQMNLSETVFLCQPTVAEAHYRARIFTPRKELPFAGHPTVAAAFSHLKSSAGDPDGEGLMLTQECGVGLIPIAIGESDGGSLFTIGTNAPSRTEASIDPEWAGCMLGCSVDDLADAPIEVCSVGLPWMIVAFRSLTGLQQAVPNQRLIETSCIEAGATGITAYSPEAESDGCDFHVRSFAPGEGIPEDPVCGSGNGAAAVHIAAHLRSEQDSFTYWAEQGLEIGRRGRARLAVENNLTGNPAISLGGHAVTVMKGELYV